MAYHASDLEVATEEYLKDDQGWQEGDPPVELYDSDGDPRRPPCVFLPHRCDHWVIGGLREVDQLIADLQNARQQLVAAGAK